MSYQPLNGTADFSWSGPANYTANEGTADFKWPDGLILSRTVVIPGLTLHRSVVREVPAGQLTLSRTVRAVAPLVLSRSVIRETPAGQLPLARAVIRETPAGQLPLLRTVELLNNVPAGQLVLSRSVIRQTAAGQLTLSRWVRDDVTFGGADDRWTARIMIDGVDVSGSVSGSDDIRIYAEEGQARTCSLTLLNEPGVVELHGWAGRSISVDYLDDDGLTLHRLFTGIVEVPEYSRDRTRTALTCITPRTEKLNAMSRTQLAQLIGGYWSEHVFDADAENSKYAEDRLKTVPASLHFDGSGNPILTPYAPKAVADFVLTDADVHRNQITFTFASRKQVQNQIDLELTYRYTRLRHRERSYEWLHPHAGDWTKQIADPINHPPRKLITDAIEGTGWDLGKITFEELPGSMRVGNTVYVAPPKGIFALRANWTMAKRFTQTIEEKYTVRVRAPQSIDQYGAIPVAEQKIGAQAEYDDEQWEGLEGYISPTGAGYNPPLVKSANGDWVRDTDTNRAAFENACATAIAKARVEMLDAHRRNFAEFTLNNQLLPIDLSHTLDLNTVAAAGRGRVKSVEYVFNHVRRARETRVQLAFSQVISALTPTDSPIAAPPQAAAAADQARTVQTIQLRNHLGNHSFSPEYDESWSGLIWNYLKYDRVQKMNIYPNAFVVDTEAVEELDRDVREAVAEAEHTVVIPHDALTIWSD